MPISMSSGWAPHNTIFGGVPAQLRGGEHIWDADLVRRHFHREEGGDFIIGESKYSSMNLPRTTIGVNILTSAGEDARKYDKRHARHTYPFRQKIRPPVFARLC